MPPTTIPLQPTICTQCFHLTQDIILCRHCQDSVPRLLDFPESHSLEFAQFSHKLNSNMLTEADRNELREILDQSKSLARTYLSLLTALQDNYRVLSDAIPIMERGLKGTGIQRLPPEVLSLVFSYVVTEQTHIYAPEYRIAADVLPSLSLAEVCTLWRRVALNTPSLWSDLRLDTPLERRPVRDLDRNRNARASILDLFLARSREGSLSVQISYYVYPLPSAAGPEPLELARKVFNHLHRIKELTIPRPFIALIPNLSTKAQALRRLNLTAGSAWTVSSLAYDLPPLDLSHLKQLCHLECAVPMISTSSQISPLDVTSLILNGLWESNPWFWEIFPKLRVLRVTATHCTMPDAMPTVHLPQLETLSVGTGYVGQEPIEIYLHWYNAPNVKNVTIAPPFLWRADSTYTAIPDDEEPAAPFDPHGFITFCRRSCQCLKLVLSDIRISPESLLEALTLLWDLEDLTIKNVYYIRQDAEDLDAHNGGDGIDERFRTSLGSSFFRGLTRGSILPRLRSMDIETPVKIVHSEVIMDMLSHRLERAGLKSARLYFKHQPLPFKLRSWLPKFSEGIHSDVTLVVEHDVYTTLNDSGNWVPSTQVTRIVPR
ncbi:hypothetical protein DL96DRAFT_1503305 [Flagelloscypha sp. PMI_526]|nr:hypothetical protein DL96DRAFT_1503305 [Flagelloscypha sp. PMI_526]